jgi:hypothetical protein
MKKAILVGSKPNANWQGKLEKNLSRVGIEIVGVWRKPGDPARRGVFAGATSVLLTNDCCSHTLQDAAKSEAKRANLPLIVINHRWSSCSQILEKHGITAESAEKAQGESRMARGRKANGPSRAEWKDILRPLVEKNPQMGPAAVAEKTKDHGTNHYTRDAALREVRKELGWAWNKRAAAFVQADWKPDPLQQALIDAEKREKAVADVINAKAKENPDWPSESNEKTGKKWPWPEPAEAPVGAPTVAGCLELTLDPSEPAEAPTEAATGLQGDVQAALALLLAMMRQHDVEHVELWANGKANFRCKVVTYTSGTMNVTAEEL